MNYNKFVSKSIVVISVAVLFFLIVAAIISAVFINNVQSDFYSAVNIAINKAFYYQTIIILVISSVIYSPISYGISAFFIESANGKNPSLSEILYLFKKPKVLLKAILIMILTSLLKTACKILLLIGALVTEIFIFFVALSIKGIDILSFDDAIFYELKKFFMSNEILICSSIILWAAVIFFIVLIRINFILCKYSLIFFEDLGVIESIKIGLISIKKNIFKTFWFYIKYISGYILTIITFGYYKNFYNPKKQKRFSVFAYELVLKGREKYFEKISPL